MKFKAVSIILLLGVFISVIFLSGCNLNLKTKKQAEKKPMQTESFE
ncbi:hypothetical protein ACFL2K_01250 [Candidatus Margulisiibacteriota bacterium]